MAIPETDPVTIDESMLNRALRYVAPGVILAIGVGGFASLGRFGWVAFFFCASGVSLLIISLVDAPTKVVFDNKGVHRHCVLRVHLISWDDLTALERPPRAPSPMRGIAKLAGAGERKTSGLLARVGPKRRYLLVSRAERPDQWDKLSTRLKVWAPAVSLPGRPRN